MKKNFMKGGDYHSEDRISSPGAESSRVQPGRVHQGSFKLVFWGSRYVLVASMLRKKRTSFWKSLFWLVGWRLSRLEAIAVFEVVGRKRDQEIGH